MTNGNLNMIHIGARSNFSASIMFVMRRAAILSWMLLARQTPFRPCNMSLYREPRNAIVGMQFLEFVFIAIIHSLSLTSHPSTLFYFEIHHLHAEMATLSGCHILARIFREKRFTQLDKLSSSKTFFYPPIRPEQGLCVLSVAIFRAGE
jgi:hypothetical protein